MLELLSETKMERSDLYAAHHSVAGCMLIRFVVCTLDSETFSSVSSSYWMDPAYFSPLGALFIIWLLGLLGVPSTLDQASKQLQFSCG